MDLCTSTNSRRQSTGRVGQGTISGESQRQRYAPFSCYADWLVSNMDNSERTTSIHILDDDSLLHVFNLYRPFFTNEDGITDWRYNGHWWYALAQVCQRWRNVVLGSATYLGLTLLCTYGTPVADMLSLSPHLPLVLCYFTGGKDRGLTTEDEEGIILALKQHDRVRRIRLYTAGTTMQKLIMAMDEEYPILEYLYIARQLQDNSTILRFPETLQTPHLRYLLLQGFALPIGSRLLTTAVGLVTLHLPMIHPSTYFRPNTLIQWISLMSYLETINIYFKISVPNLDVERQLTHTPITVPITLPNLHRFVFRGDSAYLEALVHRITTPRLEKLEIEFFNQLTFSIPHLLQFMNTAENLTFDRASFNFYDKLVSVGVYPPGETKLYALSIVVKCQHLDWQVSSMAQIFNSLSQTFSAVENLALQHDLHRQSSEEHDEVDRTEWRKFLRSFRNVKTLRIRNGLVKDLSLCLGLEDGELPLELLPELQELTYYGSGDTRDAFASFIDARRNAAHPVTLVRR
jgi:hypothetical protein